MITIVNEKALKAAMKESASGVSDERKEEILAHIQAAAGRGIVDGKPVLDELHTIFLLPAKEGGLNQAETAFYKKLVEGEPSEIIVPSSAEIVTPNISAANGAAAN